MKTGQPALSQRTEGGRRKSEIRNPKSGIRRSFLEAERWFGLLRGGCLLLLLCALGPLPGKAGLTLKTLVTFYGTNGAQPYAGLTLGADGNFYGVTSAGGSSNLGTVFVLDTNGYFTTLVSFDGTNGATPGALPLGGLIQGIDGNFYGTTSAGGSNDLGTVFAVNALGQFATLGSFDGTNGSGPQCVLAQDPSGTLYGTTEYGGAYGFGAVFSSPPLPPARPGSVSPLRTSAGISLLASFDSTTGTNPVAGLTWGYGGNLYGVASAGGPTYDAGTFFMVIPPGGPLLPLFSFSETNGSGPQGSLLLSTNISTNLYNYYSTVSPTNAFDYFYGVTAGGGADGEGTIVGLTAEGSLTNVLSFPFGGTNGANPEAGLIEGADGNYYGTTFLGGLHGSGAIFSFNPSNSTPIKLLYSFAGGSDGANPNGGLVQGSDGNFYGTTTAGGKGKKGTVFKLSGFVPYIITQPANQGVLVGNSITLAVAAGGSAPLVYEWQHNGKTLSNSSRFSGTATPLLTITNAILLDAGSYSVIVKNVDGHVTSSNVTLTVINPPSRPLLKITGPAQNTYLPTSAITVTGNTGGTTAVERVSFRLNNGIWRLATPISGWTHWSAEVTLTPGTNLFQAYAVSDAGLPSITNSAYFVPSPFAQVAGTYHGLFFDTNNVTPTNAGFFTLQNTYKGKFTGSLQLAGAHHSFHGQFDANGVGLATNLSNKSQPLNVALQLDMTQGTGHITGSVSNLAWAANLAGDLAVFNADTNAAPQQGRYTLVIPGSGAAPQPAGESWGTARVSAGGSVHLSGSLADGTSVAQTVPVSRDGAWPLYASLYRGQGLLLGWLAFSSDSNETLGGEVLWLKPALSKANYYTNGLTLQTSIQGSPYTAPGHGTNLFDATNLVVTLSGGGLAPGLTNLITLNANNQLVKPIPNKLSLSVSTSAGSFKGRVVNPATSKSISFTGVVLQNQGAASGFFLDSGQSGDVSITPQAAP